jgi:hypothetical protein
MLKHRTIISMASAAALLTIALAAIHTGPSKTPFNDWLAIRSGSYFMLFRDVPFWEGKNALLARDGEHMRVVNDESVQPYYGISKLSSDMVLVPVARGYFPKESVTYHVLRRGDTKARPILEGRCPSAAAFRQDAAANEILCVRCDDGPSDATQLLACLKVTVTRLDLDLNVKAQQSVRLPQFDGACRYNFSIPSAHPIIVGLRQGAPVLMLNCVTLKDQANPRDFYIQAGPGMAVVLTSLQQREMDPVQR